jgi:hypothetical protein
MLEYQLQKLAKNRHVMARIDKGMYGLPQAGILANKILNEQLEPHGYRECEHTPGLWCHNTRALMFSLVVDDFGIQYTHLPDAQHLLAALKQHYEAITVDWTGSLFCGISLQWNYTNRMVDLSMPHYVQDASTKFEHQAPIKSEHQPHWHNPPQFGVKTQLTEPVDNSAPLNKQETLCLQQITSKFLYYSRAVDPTMNVALSTLATNQRNATDQAGCYKIPQLLHHTPACHHTLSRFRYDPQDPLRRVIQLGTTSTQSHGRAFLPGQQRFAQ